MKQHDTLVDRLSLDVFIAAIQMLSSTLLRRPRHVELNLMWVAVSAIHAEIERI